MVGVSLPTKRSRAHPAIAFQTAVTLAVYDSKKTGDQNSVPKITQQHFEQVVKMSGAFKKYIKGTHEGVEDKDRAYKLGNRDDDHNRKNVKDSS